MTDVRPPLVTEPEYDAPVGELGDGSDAGAGSIRRPEPPAGLDRASPDREREHGRARLVEVPQVHVRTVVAVGCIGIGALILLFVLYLVAFTPVTASRNQHKLVQSLISQPLFRYNLASGTIPPDGSAVAVLSIPSLGLHQVVVEGTSAADLMNGPGLMPGTSLPGTPGNAVIAGRRVTYGAPFASIGSLRRGARIKIVDGAGTWTYRVTRTFDVSSGERDVVAPTADNRLTLITSNSTISTSGRLVVVAKIVGAPYGVLDNAVAIPTDELGLSGDPSAGGLVLLWTILSLLVLVAAGIVAWRWKRPWLVYLFAAPVFIACGLSACESLARALPATF